MARVIRTQPTDFTGNRHGTARTRAHVVPLQLPSEPNGRIHVDTMPGGDDIAALTEWVGYDPSRAKAAMVAEHDREHIRPEVISHLASVSTRESS